MRSIGVVVLGSCALLLAACFSSDEPLITPANADYPFVRESHWTGDMPGDVADLTLEDGYYHYSSEPTGRYLFKSIGENFFAVQECKAKQQCIYALIRLDGKDVYTYRSECTQRVQDDFLKGGAISHVEIGVLGQGSGTCYIKDLDGLIAVFRSLEGEAPASKAMFE